MRTTPATGWTGARNTIPRPQVPWISPRCWDSSHARWVWNDRFTVAGRPAEPPSADVLRLLRESTERARQLIDGVLVYARVGELRKERVALDRLVAEVAEDLRPGLETTGATLVVDELPEVDGDPRQLRRVLQNLVGNALKFRSEAPPRIELSAQRDTHEWVVTVRDNGLGVNPKDASRLFGMFARARSDADGMGIGLAVCRRVVEAHGGRIWVEAAEDGGSAFRFTLPR
jgi:signal transduction histidine kinase